MNMGDFKEALNVLKYFCRQTSKVNKSLIRDCLTTLKQEAKRNGLPEDVLSVCAEFIMKKCNTSVLFQEIVMCMIPQETVPEHVVSCVLMWVQSHFRDGFTQAVVLALQWVAGLLEFGLANENSANEYYYLFLSLLEWKHTHLVASWLVNRLTEPNDVDRNAVLRVLHIKRKTRSKHMDIILWCFKTFKPECVPEPISSYNVIHTFRIPNELKISFEQAHQRNVANASDVQTKLKHPDKERLWKVSEGKKRKRHAVELIPRVQYVYFGSSLYRKKETLVLELTDWKQISLHMLKIGIPCNVMSLLQNPYGHHIVAFGGNALQSRFSYTLFYTLQNVILERLVEVPMTEQEDMLNKICDFQENMQEGIPVVARFLAIYIPFWDGITFLPQLLRLLPWITFLSFGELKQLFLVYLYYVYISSNVQVKLSILRSLRNLVSNMIMEIDTGDVKLFLSRSMLENIRDCLFNLIQFIESLFVLGLNFEQDSAIMLNDVLSFYEFLVDIEDKLKLQARSVLPPVAVYYSLFSRNFVNLDRVCTLLLKYGAYPSLQVSSPIKYVDKVKLIKRYKSDFINLLWHGLAFSKRKSGFIFKDVKTKNIQNIENIVDVNEAFTLIKNVPLICVWERDPGKRKQIFTRLLQTVLPSVYDLLTITVQEKGEKLSN